MAAPAQGSAGRRYGRGVSTLERAKTVLWLYGFGVGGAERQALAFAKYLRDRHGALSEVWAFEENGPMTTLCDEAGVPWRSLPIWPMPVRSRALAVASVRAAAALRKAKTEIVLPYMTPANILCCSAWRFARARTCVWNQRNGGIEEIHRGAERFAARRAPALVANSDQGARFLVDTIGAARDRVHVIRNAVLLDAPRLDRAAWRAQLGANDTSFVVAMLANLHRWKDHETLLRAWAIARAELPGE